VVVDIHKMPCEIPDAVAFNEDHALRTYDPNVARAYWRAMLQVKRVFLLFRSRFVGKCSPIHLFWGSFDLAVTRFSGRDAPPHPGGMPHVPNAVAREAYSREVQAQDFGPVSIILPSTVMLIPHRRASNLRKLDLRPRYSTLSSENSCCPTTRFAPARIRTLPSCSSCKARTRQPQILLIGSGHDLSEHKADSVSCPSTLRSQAPSISAHKRFRSQAAASSIQTADEGSATPASAADEGSRVRFANVGSRSSM
jgi:hypothetical protein